MGGKLERGQRGRPWAASGQGDQALCSFRPRGPRVWTPPVACPCMRRWVGRWDQAGMGGPRPRSPREQPGPGGWAGVRLPPPAPHPSPPRQPRAAIGHWDNQGPQGAEIKPGLKQRLKLMGSTHSPSWEGRSRSRRDLGALWTPLLGLVALDKLLSAGRGACRGPHANDQRPPAPLGLRSPWMEGPHATALPSGGATSCRARHLAKARLASPTQVGQAPRDGHFLSQTPHAAAPLRMAGAYRTLPY